MRQSIALSRPPGSAQRLRELVIERAAMPFAWGYRDCCLWAADAVLAVTGTDPVADIRGTYFSAKQAARVMRDHGGLETMLRDRLGDPIDDPIDGDVCLLMASAHQYELGMGALGVLWRGGILVQGVNGLAMHPTSDAAVWWRVSP